VPATFFVVVDRVGNGNGKTFWWDRAYYYFKELQRREREERSRQDPGKEIMALLREFKKHPSHLFASLNTWDPESIEDLLDLTQARCRISDELLVRENTMLSWEQIVTMSKDREVGSHTCSHANLIELGQSQRIYEIAESKKRIENAIKKTVRTFSYPAGNMNNEIKTIVQDAGYEFAVTTHPGVNNLSDRYAFKRINLWEETSLSLSGKFSKGYFAYRLAGF
jgi:peptidoglycan/xylan/chitin deacetylase (PgdA/CDA1 family)